MPHGFQKRLALYIPRGSAHLYNSNLELAYRGSIDDNVNRAEEVTERYLEMAMTRMAAGKKIKTTETKAVGCSIKRVIK